MVKKVETLDDKTIEFFHGLTKDLKRIARKGDKVLMGLLDRYVSDYFEQHKNPETGILKFEDDNEKREFAHNMWEKAAEHIAEKYLKMKKEDIAELKKLKDPENPDKSQFENMMQQYMGGIDKETMYDQIETILSVSADTKGNLYAPLYQGHIASRTSKHIERKVKTMEDAQKLLRYAGIVAQHNPVTFEGYRVPTKVKSVREAADHYAKEVVQKVPHAYDPLKKETFEPKEKEEAKQKYKKAVGY